MADDINMMPKAQYNTIIFTLFSLTVLTTLLRFYGRCFVVKAWGLDDSLAAVAFLFAIVSCVLEHIRIMLLYDIFMFFDTQPWALAVKNSIPKGERSYQLLHVKSIIYGCLLATTKISVLAFYHRLVWNVTHKRVLYISGAIIILWTICFGALSFLYTSPIAAIWRPYTYQGEKVYNYPVTNTRVLNSAFQTFFDLLLLVLPIPILLRLKTSKRIKLGLVIIYSLGFLSLAITCIGIPLTIKNNTLSFGNVVAFNPTITAWTAAETNTVFICANLPGVVTLFKKSKVRILGSLSKMKGYVQPVVRNITIRRVTTHNSSDSSKSLGATSNKSDHASLLHPTPPLAMTKQECELGVLEAQPVHI